MPARHSYIGECEHEFEVIYPSVHSEMPGKIPCECKRGTRGKCLATMTWSAPRKPAYLTPIIYYEDKSGKVYIATDDKIPAPKGFLKKEVQLLSDAQKLEHRLNEQEKSKSSAFREMSHIKALQNQMANREILMSGEYIENVDDEGNVTGKRWVDGYHTFSPAMKDFADAMIEKGNREIVKETRAIDPELFFHVLQNDQRRR